MSAEAGSLGAAALTQHSGRNLQSLALGELDAVEQLLGQADGVRVGPLGHDRCVGEASAALDRRRSLCDAEKSPAPHRPRPACARRAPRERPPADRRRRRRERASSRYRPPPPRRRRRTPARGCSGSRTGRRGKRSRPQRTPRRRAPGPPPGLETGEGGFFGVAGQDRHDVTRVLEAGADRIDEAVVVAAPTLVRKGDNSCASLRRKRPGWFVGLVRCDHADRRFDARAVPAAGAR